MQVIIPTTVTDGTFTRASSATYWNSSGVLSTAAVDVLRIGYDPLNLSSPPFAIIENAATNLLLNSATLVTQSVTTTATLYTLSYYGTGSVTLTGSASGLVVGVGASPNRTVYTFSALAGTLTLTVAGSCVNAQLEASTAASSYIPTTGAAATRAADITGEGLIYSSITEPEAGWPAWNSGTTYALDAQVTYLHRRYTSLQASNTNHNPLTDTTVPAYWLDVGPTNRYAMFDSVIGTSTSATTTMTVVIKASDVGGISLMQMIADRAKISVSILGGELSYSRDLNLSGGMIIDWWEYFNNPIVRTTDYVLTDVPPVLNAYVTLVLSVTSGTVSIGNMVVGGIYEFINTGCSATASSPTIGIIDYGVKTTDAFGNVKLLPRGYAKRMNVKLMLDSTQVDRAASKLAAIRATPCVWIAAENLYQSLIVYGYYKDWEIEIAYTTKSYCSIQIEGLI